MSNEWDEDAIFKRNEVVDPSVLERLKAVFAGCHRSLEGVLNSGALEEDPVRRAQVVKFLGELTDELNAALARQPGLDVETYAQDNRPADALVTVCEMNGVTGEPVCRYFNTIGAAAGVLNVTESTMQYHRRQTARRVREKKVAPWTLINGTMVYLSRRWLFGERLPRGPRPAGA